MNTMRAQTVQPLATSASASNTLGNKFPHVVRRLSPSNSQAVTLPLCFRLIACSIEYHRTLLYVAIIGHNEVYTSVGDMEIYVTASVWHVTKEKFPIQNGHKFHGINIYGKPQLSNTYYYNVLEEDIGERRDPDRFFRTTQPSRSFAVRFDAPFDLDHKQHEPTCLDNTQVGLLQETYN